MKLYKLIKRYLNLKNYNSSGFTLAELLVAFTLFIFILGVLTSVFIISNRSQKNIQALVLVNDNTYLALEQIARDIRDGKDFKFDNASCSFPCSPPFFKFRNRNGEDIIYDYLNGSIRITNLNTGQGPDNITASNVDIASFSVTPNYCIVDPSDPSTAPVRITINLEVKPRNAPNSEGFVNHIQTTVANRNLATCTI